MQEDLPPSKDDNLDVPPLEATPQLPIASTSTPTVSSVAAPTNTNTLDELAEATQQIEAKVQELEKARTKAKEENERIGRIVYNLHETGERIHEEKMVGDWVAESKAAEQAESDANKALKAAGIEENRLRTLLSDAKRLQAQKQSAEQHSMPQKMLLDPPATPPRVSPTPSFSVAPATGFDRVLNPIRNILSSGGKSKAAAMLGAGLASLQASSRSPSPTASSTGRAVSSFHSQLNLLIQRPDDKSCLSLSVNQPLTQAEKSMASYHATCCSRKFHIACYQNNRRGLCYAAA